MDNEHPKVSLKTTFIILYDAQKPVWGATFRVLLGDQMISSMHPTYTNGKRVKISF